nr:hypothetical protein [Streptomyces arboris]
MSAPVGQERFLSERCSSLPDIDVDVESVHRLEVYDRIIDRFGRERIAVTGMPETYRPGTPEACSVRTADGSTITVYARPGHC